MRIRRYCESDLEALTDVWLRSVKATHHFLSEEDIAFFLPLVRGEPWCQMETWILESDDRKMAGFMSLEGDKMEALFIAPENLHQGLGTRRADHAKRRREKLCVDVNEQNEGACAFYRACGFTSFGRSETDSQGKPFPLIHMRLSKPNKVAQRTGASRSVQATNRTSSEAGSRR